MINQCFIFHCFLNYISYRSYIELNRTVTWPPTVRGVFVNNPKMEPCLNYASCILYWWDGWLLWTKNYASGFSHTMYWNGPLRKPPCEITKYESKFVLQSSNCRSQKSTKRSKHAFERKISLWGHFPHPSSTFRSYGSAPLLIRHFFIS